MSGLHKITEHSLSLMEGKPDLTKKRLSEAHDLFFYLEEHFPSLLKTLQTKQVL